MELVAWLYRTGGVAASSSAAARPPLVYQSDSYGRKSLHERPGVQNADRAAFVEDGSFGPVVGNGEDIVRRGEYLFATSDRTGLEVSRLGGPTDIPQRLAVSGPTNGGSARHLVVGTNVVCVVRGARGQPSEIQILDVTAPQSPVQLSAFGSAHYATYGCLLGQRLYLGLLADDAVKAKVTTNLVEAVDISDPRHPVSLGRLALAGRPDGLLAAGSDRVVALLGESVALIDVSDPARLKMIGNPLPVPASTGVLMPWGDRRLLITGAAAVSVAENELKLEGWLPGRGSRGRATSEGDLAIIPNEFGAYVFQVRPPP